MCQKSYFFRTEVMIDYSYNNVNPLLVIKALNLEKKYNTNYNFVTPNKVNPYLPKTAFTLEKLFHKTCLFWSVKGSEG